jgi:hypothetical protein
VTGPYRRPEALTDRHDISRFACRSVEQTEWLQRFSRQSAAAGTTKVFVVTETTGPMVVAYYAWCMAQIGHSGTPDRLRKGAGRYPQPVALLARLGVDSAHEGQGLGAGMLLDVLARLVDLSTDIGCPGLLLHAESTEARDFYRHLVPELEPSPTDELHLVLLMKDIRRSLDR